MMIYDRPARHAVGQNSGTDGVMPSAARYGIALLVGLMAGGFVAGLGAQLADAQESPGEGASEKGTASDAEALQLFEERIMPIFRSPTPSSCVQCHLSAVDLKNYILPSHTETFFALREDGLVNVEKPLDSKILRLIQMGEEDQDRGARLIHARTRKAEYEAFAAWIVACCSDPALRDAPAPSTLPSVGATKPLEVVRHTRKSRLAESFDRNIFSQRMRCFPCHTPHELDPANPKHKVPIQRQAELVDKFGQKMNFFEKSAEATMAKLIRNSRRHADDAYPLINVEEPSKSLLILKPTSKLPQKLEDGTFAPPSSMDPVSHMGGLKMHVNDQSYKSFMLWLQDYADSVHGKYDTARDLPADNWIPTKRILRVREVPTSWGDQTVVQLFVHAAEGDGFSKEPIAFTQGTITPRRMVNGALFVIGRQSKPPLQPGRYLVRAYVDSQGLIHDEPTLLLGQESFVGEAVIDARWRLGFPQAENLSADQLKQTP